MPTLEFFLDKLGRWQALLILTLTLIGLPHLALSQSTPPSSPMDPKELETFLDQFLIRQMEELHIPGLAFALVKDGKIFFSKGYGYANIEKKIPVDPEKTLFRVASVSKLFTATAIMQLYEQGKLKLDDDVNKYLTLFKLEDNYPKPVTIAHLLTHTGGFDDRGIGMAARKQSEVIPLSQYLAKNMPRRVRPPGTVMSYSNHGMALAGYLVEVITGVPFAQYIDENILKRLGMGRSSFLLPTHLAQDVAVGYELRAISGYEIQPYDYSNIAPAGSLNATAKDMAHFMIAQLQNGRYENTRILQEATAQEMHRQHFTHNPRMAGITYGFFEAVKNNQRVIWHDGGWPGFYSLLYLLPEQNLGFFLAVNSLTQGSQLQSKLIQEFFDHYYPIQEKTVAPQPLADSAKQAKRFEGTYQNTRYARGEITKFLRALASEVRLTADSDGVLTLRGFRGSEPTQWVEVELLLFQRLDGKRYMAFREDMEGNITYMLVEGVSYERVADYESVSFQLSTIDSFQALVQATCAFMEEPLKDGAWAQLARQIACLAGVSNLAIAYSFIPLLAIQAQDLVYGMPLSLNVFRKISLLTATLTLTLPIFAVATWVNGDWTFEKRVFYSVATLATLGFTAELFYWNLMNFHPFW
jgi:CubicO group peptidase (beta-lactamase class C family)